MAEEVAKVAGEPIVTELDSAVPEGAAPGATPEQTDALPGAVFTERHYVATVVTPGGTFKQMVKVKGAGGLLSDDHDDHPKQLEQHLVSEIHPRAISAKVERFDPNNSEHTKLRKSTILPKHMAAYVGPTATGNARQPRAKLPQQLAKPAAGAQLPK